MAVTKREELAAARIGNVSTWKGCPKGFLIISDKARDLSQQGIQGLYPKVEAPIRGASGAVCERKSRRNPRDSIR